MREYGRLLPLTAFTARFTPIIAPARRMLLARAGDIDGQRPALKFLVMQLFNGTLRRFGIRKFYKRKTTRFTGRFVHHEIDRIHRTRLGKIILQIVFPGLI